MDECETNEGIGGRLSSAMARYGLLLVEAGGGREETYALAKDPGLPRDVDEGKKERRN